MIANVHRFLKKYHLGMRTLLLMCLSKLFKDVMTRSEGRDGSVIIFGYVTKEKCSEGLIVGFPYLMCFGIRSYVRLSQGTVKEISEPLFVSDHENLEAPFFSVHRIKTQFEIRWPGAVIDVLNGIYDIIWTDRGQVEWHGVPASLDGGCGIQS